MPAASDFFDRVYRIVAEIPFGRVTTYGLVAAAAGSEGAARTVGWALNGAVASGLPCHRVVNRFGALSGARHFATPTLMEDLLRSEGVAFDEAGCVRLGEHLWVPGGGAEGASGPGAAPGVGKRLHKPGKRT